jgi:hypothetical protein
VKSGNIAKEEHNTGLMRFKILNLLGQLTLQVQHIIITLNIGTNLFHLSLNVSPILFLLLIRAHRMLIHFEQLSSSALSLSQFKECFFFTIDVLLGVDRLRSMMRHFRTSGTSGRIHKSIDYLGNKIKPVLAFFKKRG